MQLNLDDKATPYLVRGYGDGEIKIGNTVYRESVLVSRDGVEPWPVAAVEALADANWDAVAATGATIVVLGTGPTMTFPPPQVTAQLARRGVGLEVMDTAAACRTFNVLANEGRPVAAIFLLGA
ncbi:MAG: Mth938-like domain-containing protein [Pseudomonadota bacterium]